MKKIVTLALLLGLVAGGAFAAPAGAKKKAKKTSRTAEAKYENPALGIGGVVTSGTAGGSAEFPLAAGERYFAVQIEDASGTEVYASLSQDTDPSTPQWEIFTGICGSSDGPIEVTPGLPVRVTVTAGPGREDPSCMGLASNGTIKATITNSP